MNIKYILQYIYKINIIYIYIYICYCNNYVVKRQTFAIYFCLKKIYIYAYTVYSPAIKHWDKIRKKKTLIL